MIINVLKFLFIIFFYTTGVYSEQVKDIQISGNKRISEQTILVLGNINKNVEYNSDTINNSLKSLYSTNFFSDIDISFNDGLLLIKIIENPIIEDIEITGIKNNDILSNITDAIGS